LDGTGVAEALAHAGQVRPVAVAEPAVAPARPAAALVGLEHDHVERRLALLQRERGPEAGVAAADNRDVGVGVTRERRRRLAAEAGLERLLDPPRLGQRRCQASSSTVPRMPTISSHSDGPATSGGEIWITGSPRSSAR